MKHTWSVITGLVILTLSYGASAAALPFTYDFGFVGSENGFSGAGSFTISTSENLSADTSGLEAFEFSGLCAGYVCTFDLADVTTAGIAKWSADEVTGELSQLAITAYGHIFDANASTRFYLGPYEEFYLDCWDKSISSAPGPCNGDYFDYRAERYPGSETYVTLRQGPSGVPVPTTAWLVGSALMGLGAIKRKKSLKAAGKG